jgi:hypothetical protein
MIVQFRQIVRRVERQRLDVEPADGAEQGIGSNHAIALRADQPRLRRNQIGLRVQDVDRGALAARGFLADALQRDRRRPHLGFRCRYRDLGAFIGDPGADCGGAGLTADMIQHLPALRR